MSESASDSCLGIEHSNRRASPTRVKQPDRPAARMGPRSSLRGGSVPPVQSHRFRGEETTRSPGRLPGTTKVPNHERNFKSRLLRIGADRRHLRLLVHISEEVNFFVDLSRHHTNGRSNSVAKEQEFRE